MKRILSMVLVLALVLALGLCGGPSGPVEGSTELPDAQITGPYYEVVRSEVLVWETLSKTPAVQVVVEAVNKGTVNLYIPSPTGQLVDAQGNEAQLPSFSVYPQIIAPGETAYLYESASLASEPQEAPDLVYQVEPQEAALDMIRLAVSDTQLHEGHFGDLSVTGTVTNDSGAPQSQVYVVGLLYGEGDLFLGAMDSVRLEELAPGDTWDFELLGLGLPTEISQADVDHMVFYAYPAQIQ